MSTATNEPARQQVEYAAWDAMQEVASSLKAAYFRRSLATEREAEIDYWEQQQDLIDKIASSVDGSDIDDIRATAKFFADRLHDLELAENAEDAA